MKQTILLLAIFLVGLIVGGLCTRCSDHSSDVLIQRDTTIIRDTMRYSRYELETNRHRLDVPKIKSPELVYIPADSATIIYQDSVQYVTYPREYFYTKLPDAEIWHSGIDSRIDSLNIFRENVKITEQIGRKNVKHSLGVGIEANYYSTLYVPMYIEYESLIKPWFSVYGRLGYNIPTQDVGLSLGLRLQIAW